MFFIVATKPLNDGTKGFRFNFFGMKGLVRKRKHIKRGYCIIRSQCMSVLHMSKLSVYVERKHNAVRKLRHFAG